MKAIYITENGGPEVLQVKDIPKPEPQKGEARIQIKAAGVNFIDIYQRVGRYPTPLPYVPGVEGAGIVDAVGDGVHEVKPGDHVAYATTLGAYAEYAVVPSSKLIPLPEQMTFAQAAAFPLQGMTAQYLLHEFYQVKDGDTVLVHAAAGGVGLLLVQWLKYMGATVIGTVSSPEKAQIAKDAGADHAILYTTQDFVEETQKLTQGKGIDYILDGVGKSTFTKNLDAVREHGHICIYGSASGPAEALVPNALQAKSLTLYGGSIFNFINTHAELLRRANAVFEGIHAGWLKLNIEHTLPLEKAAEAHQLLESRKTVGKIVLTITA